MLLDGADNIVILPILMAVAKGKAGFVSALARFGCNLNKVSSPKTRAFVSDFPQPRMHSRQFTALHYAGFIADYSMATTLLECGATDSVCIQDTRGETPLRMAVFDNNIRFLEAAIAQAPAACAKALTTRGARHNPTPWQTDATTLMELAVMRGCAAIVRLFGAFAQNHPGCSWNKSHMLEMAMNSEDNTDAKYFECVEALIVYGAMNRNQFTFKMDRKYYIRKGYMFRKAVERGLITRGFGAVQAAEMFGGHIQIDGVCALISEYAQITFEEWKLE
jgi:hypothetical protein